MQLTIKTRIGPDGLHLYDRVTGLNVLIDEINFPPHLWSNSPRYVSIAMTNACDLNCSHCYIQKNPSFLEPDKLKKWITELDKNGCLSIGFGGGEPTLYPEFMEICSYVKDQTNLGATMTTHGQGLSDKLICDLIGKIDLIRVSMDGINSTYEGIRGRPFLNLIDRIKAINHRIPFGINYLINARTISEIDSAIDIASVLGASEFLLIPELSVKGNFNIENSIIINLQRWVESYRGKIKLTISKKGSEGFPICIPFKKDTDISSFLHIDASGIIKRTSFEQSGIKIDDNGIMDAITRLMKME